VIPANPSHQRFPKRLHLRKSLEFERVYQRRQSAADDVLIVYACESEFDYPRLGLTVSRKHGNAVRRNRWKRVIREAFRRTCAQLPPGIDLVVSPKPGAIPAMTTAISSLQQLVRRAVRKLEKTKPPTPSE
jgi:ribonuclease P protein component